MKPNLATVRRIERRSLLRAAQNAALAGKAEQLDERSKLGPRRTLKNRRARRAAKARGET